MDILEGLSIVFQLNNFLLLVFGVILGIIVGAIPGLTATLAISLLLPFTFGLEATSALIMLIGIYCGGIYGGSITAILLRTPGTPGAAATVLDGYPLAQNGQAGRALGIATTASFIGGIVSGIFLIFLAPTISKFALKFSSAEFFALAFFGLTIIFSVSGGSLLKGAIAGLLGLLVNSVGMDPLVAYPRFTFGIKSLLIGFPLLPAVIGLFALTEVFSLFRRGVVDEGKVDKKLDRIIPRWSDIKALKWIFAKCSLIGTFIGALPGAGANIAAFVAYSEAKRTSKHPETFGKGNIEGVAAPETANNAVTGGALIPMLTLGVPGDAVTAVLLGALTIQGLQPGPLLFSDHPEVVNSIFAGVLVANVVMLITGLTLSTLIARIASMRKTILVPVIAIFSLLGAFASEGSLIHMRIAILFGIIGYILERNGFPLAPIALAIVMGTLAEKNFRTALIRAEGSYSIFFGSPISIFFLAIAVASIIYSLYTQIKSNKAKES